jgi:hypothetical protein
MWSYLQNQALTGCTLLYTVRCQTVGSSVVLLCSYQAEPCSEMYIDVMLSKKLGSPGILEVFMEYFLFEQYGFTQNFTRLPIVVDLDPVVSVSFLADPDPYPFQPNVNLNLNFFPENFKIL